MNRGDRLKMIKLALSNKAKYHLRVTLTQHQLHRVCNEICRNQECIEDNKSHPNYTLCNYSPAELEKLLKENGFTLEYVHLTEHRHYCKEEWPKYVFPFTKGGVKQV